MILCLQIRLVCWEARRATPWRRRLDHQLDSQRRGDRRGDFILNREDIRHLAVVALGPQIISIGSADDLRGHAQPASCSSYATLKDRSDTEDLCDLPAVRLFASKRKRRRAR